MPALVYFAAGIAALWLARRASSISLGSAIALLVLPLLFTGRALISGGIYGPVDLAYTVEPLASIADATGITHVTNPAISDTYTEFMPWHDAMRRAIRRGEWPLWNPYALSGTPLAGSAQVAPYHPITLVALLVPMPGAFAFAAAMMHLIAAISAFLLVRELTEREEPALFGAIAWACSTHLVFFGGTALANAVSVLPLVLLGARRLVHSAAPARVRTPALHSLLLIALVLVVLSGHPESALHIVSFAVLYVVFEAWRVRPRLVPLLIGGVTTGIAALLLCAIFLLPHLEAIPQSEEFIHRALGYKQTSSTGAQMQHRLIANLFPFVEGAEGIEERVHAPGVSHGWLATAYAGSLLFGLAIFAVVRSRSPEHLFFAFATLFGLAAAIAAPGFVDLMNLLPGFRIAVNDRMVAFAILGFAVLAALGLDEFLRKGSRALVWSFVISAIAVAAAAVVCRHGLSGDYVLTGATRALLPLLIATVIVIACPRHVIAPSLIALLLLQRAGETATLQPTLPAQAFYPPFPGLEVLRGPHRIAGVGNALTPEIATHYGLEDVRGFEALTFARYDATYPMWSRRQPVWFNRVDDLSSPMLSLMNVRYAITPAGTAVPPSWKPVKTFDAYSIVENTAVLPRAFVPRTIHVGRSPQATLAEMPNAQDFAADTWIETGDQPASRTNGPGTAEVIGQGGDLTIRAQMENEGWVVVSNAAWKGWQSSRQLTFANHAFLAVHLPRGTSETRLWYRPQSFVIGAIVSLLTLIGVIAFRTRFPARP